MNLNYPADLDEVSQMTVMELRRAYRFLPAPTTQPECDLLNAIQSRIQENGMMTLPIRMDMGLDMPETVPNSTPFHGQ